MSKRWILGLAALLGSTAMLSHAADWTQFRGPGGNFLTTESKLPGEWSTTKNVLWKVQLPGVAWSCPIVVGDKVFVTTAITKDQKKPKANDFGGGGFGGGKGGFSKDGKGEKGEKGEYPKGGFGKGGFGGGKAPDALYTWEVICLDRTSGKILWEEKAVEKKPTIPTHSTNTYASETPVSDGERVYAYFGMTGVFCYDLTGKQLWKTDMSSYPMMNGWGTGSSPVLFEDKLFIQCDNEEKSFLLALDKKTGKELWKKDRPDNSSWATPLVWKNKVRTELVCMSPKRIRSYNPTDGEILWELVLSEGGGRGSSSNASPVADEEQIYFGNGGQMGSTPLYAVKAGAKGNITPKDRSNLGEFVAWSSTRGAPSMSSPLLYEGHLYVFDQRGGTVACIDAKTGKEVYRERIPQCRGITSSPWAYDGKVFAIDDGGTTFVLQAGAEFKVLGSNKLEEMFWSSPAISAGSLFLRGTEHLFCIKEN